MNKSIGYVLLFFKLASLETKMKKRKKNRENLFDTNLRKKDDIFEKVGPFWTLIFLYSQFVDLIIGRGCEKLSPNILTSE